MSVGAKARTRMVSLVRKAIRRASKKEGRWVDLKDDKLGVVVIAHVKEGLRRGAYPHRTVYVEVFDKFVSSSGPLSEHIVAGVKVLASSHSYEVKFSQKECLPFNWRAPPTLRLLPTAFNAALSALGAGEGISEEFGLRVEMKRVFARSMYHAHDPKCRRVILAEFEINGRPYIFGHFRAGFSRDASAGRKHVELSGLGCIRHGDVKLARRLYLLSAFRRVLEETLDRLEEEGRGEGEWNISHYKVRFRGKEVVIPDPYIPGVVYFDEECIVCYTGWITQEVGGDESNPAETLSRESLNHLEWIRSKSLQKVVEVVDKAKELLRSKDPELSELGHILAWLIKEAYEEAERAIPG